VRAAGHCQGRRARAHGRGARAAGVGRRPAPAQASALAPRRGVGSRQHARPDARASCAAPL